MAFKKGNIPEGAKPFKKGQTGNPKGRPPKLPDLDNLLAEVLGEEKDGKTAAQAILAALRAKAVKGDIRAAEVLLNRGYGLPKQFTELTGKDGAELNTGPAFSDKQFTQLLTVINDKV